MHFIDTVFPLQYPMYRPTVFEGGRGWLLSLLLRTKPLYHASLALSAYHRGAVLYSASYRGCSTASTVHKEKHLAICLSEFQRAIKDASSWVNKMTCPSAGLGLLACVIQLIFFEARHPLVTPSELSLIKGTAFRRPRRCVANTPTSIYRFVLPEILAPSKGARSDRHPR